MLSNERKNSERNEVKEMGWVTVRSNRIMSDKNGNSGNGDFVSAGKRHKQSHMYYVTYLLSDKTIFFTVN